MAKTNQKKSKAKDPKAKSSKTLEAKSKGYRPMPYIEVPLIGNMKEYMMIKNIILKVAEELKVGKKVPFKIGTMIEVPRAAITADEIAKEADFMSFGTNDLTQMTCGFSRDDSGKFLKEYVAKGIYEKDPFQVLDQEGVGKLADMVVLSENPKKIDPLQLGEIQVVETYRDGRRFSYSE